MNRKTLFFLILFNSPLFSQGYDIYIWETYKSENISPNVSKLITALRNEVDKILTAGHLAPLRISGADQKCEGYWMYQEPGRIINTLAKVYPYLTSEQKIEVKTYVRNELSNSDWCSWSDKKFMHPTTGARREYYRMVGMKPTHMWDPDSGIWITTGAWQWDWWWAMDGYSRPQGFTLYGLWQYAYYSKDWEIIKQNWNSIKNFYNKHAPQANTYGLLSTHIAMARMAYHENDTETLNKALSYATTNFASASDFTWVENNCKYHYSFFYDPNNTRRQNGVYVGWMFLNLVPEVGRYINDTTELKNSVLTRHNSGKTKYPLWYLVKAQYGSWTGHESCGLVPEVIGMILPVERWVVSAPKEILYSYHIENSFYGIGDCYAIEALADVISSYGTDTWVDVRYEVTVDTLPPSAVTDLKVLEEGNNYIKISWTAPGDDGKTGNAFEYDLRYSLNPIQTEQDFNISVSLIGEPIPSPSGTVENMIISNLSPGTTYYFAMKVYDENGNNSLLSNTVSGRTTGNSIEPSITLIYPNGGETFGAGTQLIITWKSSGAVSNINIDFSSDEGSNWINLSSNVPNDGRETVTLPIVYSNRCKIRISETDGIPYDISDGLFSLVPTPLNPPLLATSVNSIDFGEVKFNDSKTISFNLWNAGGGIISGTITSSVVWIKVEPENFNSNSITVYVTVDNSILKQKKNQHTGNIIINSTGGDAVISVNLTATCVLTKPNPYEPEKGKLTFFGDGIIPDGTEIKIYSFSGELIKEIKKQNKDSQITWDGKNEEGKTVVPGIYIYTYKSSKEKGTGKFTVIK